MHLPFLEAGGHAPALALGSLRLLRARLLSCWRGRWGPAAPRAAPRPLPFHGGGRGALPFLRERWDPPPSRACLMLLGRRGLVPLSSAGEKRGGYGALLRNILIRELRLPFNPTGRHCLNGRSTQKGEKGTSWSESVGLELGTAPRGITPLRLRGRPDPHATSPLPPPHTHRLLECLYSLFWFPETSLKFSYLGIGGRVFFWKFTRRQKGLPTQENSEPRHIPSCLGTGSLLLPSSPGSALSLQGTLPAWAAPQAHSPILSPKLLCAHSGRFQWEKLRHEATRG